MTPLIIAAIVLLTVYILAVCIINKEIPSSLSESVFYLPKTGAWVWMLVIAGVAFLSVPTFIEKVNESIQFLAFLSCAALAFVGACPLVGSFGNIDKSTGTYTIHMASAFACGVLSQIAVFISNPWLILCWLPWVSAFVWISKDEKWRTATFWAEMTCFASTFIFCLI